jgi:hypothetical protein
MLIRYAPMHSPCDPAVVSADVGRHPGSVKPARLSSAALTPGCARTLG